MCQRLTFLYEPTKKPLRGVGEVIGRLPLPGDPAAGPMHRVPSLEWTTWMRLALVEAGADWRSLNRLRVENGQLADYALMPETSWNNGVLGVTHWGRHASTITSNGRPGSGNFAVADPRFPAHPKSVQLGVRRWEQTSGVVTGNMWVGGGPNAIADPRYAPKQHLPNTYRLVPRTNVAALAPANDHSVADPRPAYRDAHKNVLRVVEMKESAPTVTGQPRPSNGGLAVADPRPGYPSGTHTNLLNVSPYDRAARAITGAVHVAGGALSVADPRQIELPTYNSAEDAWSEMPGPRDRVVARIIAPDGTWHRPFTSLDLTALQGLIDPDELFSDGAPFALNGRSDAQNREWIGNMIPPPAARAMGETIAETLLMAGHGITYSLSSREIWVRPIALALAVDVPELAASR